MPTPIRAALPAVALATLAAAIAVPTLTSSAQTPASVDITVRDKIKAVVFVHAKPTTRGERLATGDRVITRQGMFDERDAPIGTLTTDCVNVGATAPVFKATLQCTSIYRFRDGQIVSAGVVKLDSAKSAPFPIVGGSGAYTSASGDITAGKPVKGYDTVDVLHLAP